MYDEKPWYKSKTIIASAVAILATIASFFGFDVTEDQQAMITDGVLQVIAFVFMLIAIFGRVTAKDKIG
jgi:Mg2+ and Co2+ transporter CorA